MDSFAAQAITSRPSLDLRTKHGWPVRQSWEDHKSIILEYYADRNRPLKDIVEQMRDEHHFSATPAMYKSRLRKWGAYRNQKHGRQTDQHTVGRSSSPGRSTSEDLNEDRPGVGACPVETLPGHEGTQMIIGDFGGGLAQYPSPTPYQMESSNLESYRVASSTISSEDCGTESSSDGPRYTPEDSAYSARASGASTGSANLRYPQAAVLQASLVSSSCTEVQPPAHDVQQWLSSATAVEAIEGDHLHRMSTPLRDPKEFVQTSFQYCKHWADGRYAAADAFASEAYAIYVQLLRQQSRHALTVLNTVLACVLLYEMATEAFELMQRARAAAKFVLPTSHPMIQVIEFLMFQVAGQHQTVSAKQLHDSYDSLSNALTTSHPHSIVAGYLFAWRMTANQDDDMELLQAVQLLCQLQLVADRCLGLLHNVSIAILMAKVRAQHVLRMYPDALANMETAIARMRTVYPELHPWILDARYRYAELLFAVYRDDEAEREYTKSALGQVEVFGREHATPSETVHEVKRFFAATKRQNARNRFLDAVFTADLKHRARTSEHRHLLEGRVGRA